MIKARVVTAGASVVVIAAAGWLALNSCSQPAAPAAPTVVTTTAPVTRGDVSDRVEISGTLGYAGNYDVRNQLPSGILTAVAGPGAVVSRGGQLFAVSGAAVLLLYGDVPAYRDFSVGMTDGPDVRELKQNLTALGFRPGALDNHFGATTAAAIRRWQTARGVPAAERTGHLRLGEVAFLPSALRVTQDTGLPGGRVGPGAPVLGGTTTTQVVTAPVDTDQRYLVHAGDQVQVSFPSGATVPGTIVRIGQVATTPQSDGGPATVTVTVAVRLPRDAGDLDQAPVQVSITVAVHHGVLQVPVTALLAKPGGGYQVRVRTGDVSRLVDVRPGLYDDSTGDVEVSGAGLSEGMTVEVPAT
ncbi:MAG TPA: peptidoglycan-binding domain-containing protein [Mycobacterium sp.]|jgi:peptidoglycan hydrolase-like protein with peptidoglycan-binding domain|nr:peptidoglycan-binding domain-containing protein [Micromonosporaceae bacterium]